MFSQYFGYYLLEKGYINFAQLEEVWEHQKKTHVKLGLLAVSEGLLSVEQAEQVHAQQMQKDKKFGEIAVEAGFLTEEQLNGLLSSHKNNHLFLAQALVEKKYMNLYQIAMTLFQYKKEHGLSDEQFASIKNGDIRTLVDAMLKIREGMYPAVIVDYLSLLVKNVIRFIDPHVWLEFKEWNAPIAYEWMSFQQIQGELTMYTYIVSDRANWIKTASRYAGEPLFEADEMAEASVGEFLNLQNGIFLVNMSDRGQELSLTPQYAKSPASMHKCTSSILVTVHYTEGSFDFITSTAPAHIKQYSLVNDAASL